MTCCRRPLYLLDRSNVQCSHDAPWGIKQTLGNRSLQGNWLFRTQVLFTGTYRTGCFVVYFLYLYFYKKTTCKYSSLTLCPRQGCRLQFINLSTRLGTPKLCHVFKQPMQNVLGKELPCPRGAMRVVYKKRMTRTCHC